MKSFFGWVRRRAVVLLTYAVLLTAVTSLYLYKQQSLIIGQNIYETAAVQRIESYQYPWVNPVDAPIIGISKIVNILGIDSLQSIRLISTALMILSILMFYQLLRNWLLSPGKAVVGTTLFATSSWALAVGRGGHTIVAGIFLLLLVFALSTRLFFTTRPFIDWLLLILAAGLSIYTPITSWLIFLAILVWLLQVRRRQRAINLDLWQKIVLMATAFIVVVPLLISLVSKPSYAPVLLGADNIVASFREFFLAITDTFTSIFFINQSVSLFSLGKLPFLDIFSVFMFLLGCYYFERRLALKRSKILFGGFTIGLVVCSLSGYDTMRVTLLMPLIYIFIAAGLHEFISRWLAVFPRNPIARGVGVVALSVAIGFVGYFHLTKTFVARPGNPEIRAMYQTK